MEKPSVWMPHVMETLLGSSIIGIVYMLYIILSVPPAMLLRKYLIACASIAVFVAVCDISNRFYYFNDINECSIGNVCWEIS